MVENLEVGVLVLGTKAKVVVGAKTSAGSSTVHIESVFLLIVVRDVMVLEQGTSTAVVPMVVLVLLAVFQVQQKDTALDYTERENQNVKRAKMQARPGTLSPTRRQPSAYDVIPMRVFLPVSSAAISLERRLTHSKDPTKRGKRTVNTSS